MSLVGGEIQVAKSCDCKTDSLFASQFGGLRRKFSKEGMTRVRFDRWQRAALAALRDSGGSFSAYKALIS